MKKKYLPLILFICAALLTAGFAIHLFFDYTLRYEFGSAPFWLYVAERFIEYMLLAIACFTAGMILRKRS